MALSVNAAVTAYITSVNAKLAHVTPAEVYSHAMQAYREGDITAMQQTAIIEHRGTVANNHNTLVDAFAAGNAESILSNMGIAH